MPQSGPWPSIQKTSLVRPRLLTLGRTYMTRHKVRVLVQGPDGAHRPVLWFMATSKDEIFWGLYGVTDGPVTLSGDWPDRRVDLDSSDIRKYHLSAMRHGSDLFDHFSSHVDGTFHLKCKGESAPIYSNTMRKLEGINNEVPIFLEAKILTDRIDLYKPSNLRSSDHVIKAPGEGYLDIFFAVAGKDHAYDDVMSDYIKPGQALGPYFEFGSFQLKSIITHLTQSDRHTTSNGTVVSFRFLMSSQSYILKAFQFS